VQAFRAFEKPAAAGAGRLGCLDREKGAPGKENPLACASGLSFRIDVYCDGRMMNCP
jgi:hypothetical protein